MRAPSTGIMALREPFDVSRFFVLADAEYIPSLSLLARAQLSRPLHSASLTVFSLAERLYPSRSLENACRMADKKGGWSMCAHVIVRPIFFKYHSSLPDSPFLHYILTACFAAVKVFLLHFKASFVSPVPWYSLSLLLDLFLPFIRRGVNARNTLYAPGDVLFACFIPSMSWRTRELKAVSYLEVHSLSDRTFSCVRRYMHATQRN